MPQFGSDDLVIEEYGPDRPLWLPESAGCNTCQGCYCSAEEAFAAPEFTTV